jgi:hypothetical protein
MIPPPKNRSLSSTASPIIQSSDTEFQIPDEIVAEVRIEILGAKLEGIKVEEIRDVKLTALRQTAEYVGAVVSLLFLGAAVQTFLPSTAKLVESSFAAAGTSFLTLLQGI